MLATDAQILDFIRTFIENNGYSPSIREVCLATGISSPGSVKYRVDILKSKGLLTYDRRKSRTIRLTAEGEELCG